MNVVSNSRTVNRQRLVDNRCRLGNLRRRTAGSGDGRWADELFLNTTKKLVDKFSYYDKTEENKTLTKELQWV